MMTGTPPTQHRLRGHDIRDFKEAMITLQFWRRRQKQAVTPPTSATMVRHSGTCSKKRRHMGTRKKKSDQATQTQKRRKIWHQQHLRTKQLTWEAERSMKEDA
jgi:hypothetical protein